MSALTTEELEKFLGPHARCVIIVRHKADLERLRHALPAGMAITRVLHADEIGIAFVQVTPARATVEV